MECHIFIIKRKIKLIIIVNEIKRLMIIINTIKINYNNYF